MWVTQSINDQSNRELKKAGRKKIHARGKKMLWWKFQAIVKLTLPGGGQVMLLIWSTYTHSGICAEPHWWEGEANGWQLIECISAQKKLAWMIGWGRLRNTGEESQQHWEEHNRPPPPPKKMHLSMVINGFTLKNMTFVGRKKNLIGWDLMLWG